MAEKKAKVVVKKKKKAADKKKWKAAPRRGSRVRKQTEKLNYSKKGGALKV